MYIHHRNVRALFQYLNVKFERKFNSILPVIARLRQKLQLIGVIDQATCGKKKPWSLFTPETENNVVVVFLVFLCVCLFFVILNPGDALLRCWKKKKA